MELRPYQAQAIADLRQALIDGYKRPLLQLATAAGKTIIAAEIAKLMAARGKRMVFVADSIELVDQTVETFQCAGLDVGVMQGDHYLTNTAAQTQIVTPQTVAARLKTNRRNFEQWEVHACVYDECHQMYQSHRELMGLYPRAAHIGITASPYSKGLGKMYDKLIVPVTMQELIDDGYLCPVDYYAPSTVDLEGLKTMANGDVDPEKVANRLTVSVVGDVIKHWQEHAGGMSTVGFAPNVASSKRFAEEFRKAGVNAVHIDGYGSSDEADSHRKESVEGFKAGRIQMLWSCQLTIKGFDAPIAQCMVDCQPTRSLCRFVQKVGRVMRLYPGKERALVLDHCGSVNEIGYPEDISIDSLDSGEKRARADRKPKDEPLPKACGQCGFVKEPKQHQCPKCGFKPERRAQIEVVEGKLVRFGDERVTKAQRMNWMYELEHVRKERGYKNGWQIFTYKRLFQEEPPVKWARKTKPPSPLITELLGASR